MTVLVTGANGFVGLALCKKLYSDGITLRAAVRSLKEQPNYAEVVEIQSISSKTDWTSALRRVDQVVHLAARVHTMNDKRSNTLTEFNRVNVEGTVNLARQAAAAGVQRFVFLSSIKVNGEFTKVGQTFTAEDVPAPEHIYGVSKHNAEKHLRQIAVESGMEVVIIRPPLVYGFGVKANFELMMRCLALGLPLPLSAVNQNRRSLVALDNLVDLIVTCLNHSAAANQTFLVSDGEDLSTAELLKRMGLALNHPARLFYIPPALLKIAAEVLNKSAYYERLCYSLKLDITKTRQLLGWNPPVSIDEGLRSAAEGFSK
jgi:nucleoside-diphosphate-sugar epimerase